MGGNFQAEGTISTRGLECYYYLQRPQVRLRIFEAEEVLPLRDITHNPFVIAPSDFIGNTPLPSVTEFPARR